MAFEGFVDYENSFDSDSFESNSHHSLRELQSPIHETNSQEPLVLSLDEEPIDEIPIQTQQEEECYLHAPAPTPTFSQSSILFNQDDIEDGDNDIFYPFRHELTDNNAREDYMKILSNGIIANYIEAFVDEEDKEEDEKESLPTVEEEISSIIPTIDYRSLLSALVNKNNNKRVQMFARNANCIPNIENLPAKEKLYHLISRYLWMNSTFYQTNTLNAIQNFPWFKTIKQFVALKNNSRKRINKTSK